MKKFAILVVLLLVAVAFSGCVDQSPEAKAKAIADNKREIKVISRMIESMGNMDKCTKDKLMDSLQRYAEIQGYPMTLPPGYEAQLDQMLSQAGEWSRTCRPTVTSKVEKESENIYMVIYNIDVGDGPSCAMMTSTSSDLEVRVDLSIETATIEGMDDYTFNETMMQQMEEAMDIMGECTAVMMFFTGGVTSM